MQAVLTLVCTKCKTLLMKQEVSCFVGNSATINVDELAKFAGPCCNRPKRTAKVEIKETAIIVEGERTDE